MAGITQGVPEVAVGEPIRLGNNGEYELEHDPITDRLIVRDTVNGTEAYVRPETNEQIGNQGAFIRSLVNGEPLADDGRTYSSIQAAEEAANGWVFVPPGTFNEIVAIKTDGLTMIGAGYGTTIDSGGSTPAALTIQAPHVTVRNLAVNAYTNGSTQSDGFRPTINADNFLLEGCWVKDTDRSCVYSDAHNGVIKNCVFEACTANVVNNLTASATINFLGNRVLSGVSGYGVAYENKNLDGCIVANNVFVGTNNHSITPNGDDWVIIGNRIHNSGDDGIAVRNATDTIVANNRVSGSASQNISDTGTGTVLDSNLTGAAN